MLLFLKKKQLNNIVQIGYCLFGISQINKNGQRLLSTL